MDVIDKRTAFDLEQYAKLGPGCLSAAVCTASSWLEQEDLRLVIFAEGARDIAVRITYLPAK